MARMGLGLSPDFGVFEICLLGALPAALLLRLHPLPAPGQEFASQRTSFRENVDSAGDSHASDRRSSAGVLPYVKEGRREKRVKIRC